MLGHVPGDLVHAFVVFEKVLQVHRAVENFIELLDIGNPLRLGDGPELFLHQVGAGQHLVGREVVIERQGGAVLDAFPDRVLMQIALASRADRW